MSLGLIFIVPSYSGFGTFPGMSDLLVILFKDKVCEGKSHLKRISVLK